MFPGGVSAQSLMDGRPPTGPMYEEVAGEPVQGDAESAPPATAPKKVDKVAPPPPSPPAADPFEQYWSEIDRLPRLPLPDLSPDMLSMGNFLSLDLKPFSFSLEDRDSPAGGSSGCSSMFLCANLELGLGGSWRGWAEHRRYGYEGLAMLSLYPSYHYVMEATPSGDDTNALDMLTSSHLSGEFRFYPLAGRSSWFLSFAGYLDDSLSMSYSDREKPDNADETSWANNTFSFSGGPGIGFGREHYIDAALRLRRVEQYLISRGILAGPLEDRLARKILLQWQALKNDRTLSYSDWRFILVLYMLQSLREAGLLVRPLAPSTVHAVENLLWGNSLRGGWRQGWRVSAHFDLATNIWTGLGDNDKEQLWLGTYLTFNYSRLISLFSLLNVYGQVYFDLGVQDSEFPWVSLQVGGKYKWDLVNRFQEYQGYLELDAWFYLRGPLEEQADLQPSRTANNFHRLSFGNYSPSQLLYAGGAGVTYWFTMARGVSYSLGVDGSVGLAQDSEYADITRIGFQFELSAAIYFDLVAGHFSSYGLIGR